MLLRPNYRGFLRGSVTLPFKVAGVVRELIENLGESSAVDLATGLAAALPPGSTAARASSGTSRRCSPIRTGPTTSATSRPSSI